MCLTGDGQQDNKDALELAQRYITSIYNVILLTPVGATHWLWLVRSPLHCEVFEFHKLL